MRADRTSWPCPSQEANNQRGSRNRRRLGEGGDQNQHDQQRNRQHNVREGADHQIHRAAEIAADQPQRGSNPCPQRAGNQTDAQGRPETVDEQGEEIAPDIIGAQGMYGRGRFVKGGVERLGGRFVDQPWPTQRADCQQPQQ